MSTYAVVGLQSGDESKGKISDYLLQKMDGAVRYSGSCNTGATVVVDGVKHKCHHLPVSVIQNKPTFIASDCLIDPTRLLQELDVYAKLGFDVDNNFFISPDCHIITSEHVERDIAAEGSGLGVGSTKRGVSPAASDKYGRKGKKLETVKEFIPYFYDIGNELNERLTKGQKILMEGSQGALLDINHGFTYPHISTTSNIAQMAYVSTGISPKHHQYTCGVFKPYVTKVGTGPFLTEINEPAINQYIVDKGAEFGTTTGRRRKVGWLDLPMLRYAIQINAADALAMCKFDVIEGMNIKVCVGYRNPKGRFLTNVPVIKSELNHCTPVYDTYNNIDLKTMVELVEDATNVRIDYISTGPERNATLDMDNFRFTNGKIDWEYVR